MRPIALRRVIFIVMTADKVAKTRLIPDGSGPTATTEPRRTRSKHGEKQQWMGQWRQLQKSPGVFSAASKPHKPESSAAFVDSVFGFSRSLPRRLGGSFSAFCSASPRLRDEFYGQLPQSSPCFLRGLRGSVVKSPPYPQMLLLSASWSRLLVYGEHGPQVFDSGLDGDGSGAGVAG